MAISSSEPILAPKITTFANRNCVQHDRENRYESVMASAREFEVPDFGLGCAPIGNLYRPLSDEQAMATVLAALSEGARYLDTAPYYGHGRSEQRVGRALRHWTGQRPVLSTKVGRVLDPVTKGEEGDFGYAEPLPFRPRFDYSRDGIRRSLDGSLARLGVERVDIALIHDIGRLTHGDAHPKVLRQVLDEALPALHDARSEGLLRWIGIGVNECEVCLELLERTELDCILLAGRYTLLEQPALTTGVLDLCLKRGTRLIAAGVFNSGLLATKPDASSPYNYADVPPAILKRSRALWQACEAFGVAPQAAAVQFPALHPVVAATIVGAKSPGEVAQILEWRRQSIPVALWTALKKAGFITGDAPIAPAT
jgi:D-threo-aldose 1-dehydrogenase